MYTNAILKNIMNNVSVTASRGAFFNNDEFNNVLSRARLESIDNTSTSNSKKSANDQQADDVSMVHWVAWIIPQQD